MVHVQAASIGVTDLLCSSKKSTSITSVSLPSRGQRRAACSCRPEAAPCPAAGAPWRAVAGVAHQAPLVRSSTHAVSRRALNAGGLTLTAALISASCCAAAASAADVPTAPSTAWDQRTITLPAKARGCHVMTREIAKQVPEIENFEVGMANLFLLHTSASLTINENASPDVPLDLNDALEKLAPEGGHYRHLDEGYDDMPAHVKSSLMGASLDIPISHGRLALGTWQGIYLNEHRNYGGARSVVVTLQGRPRGDGKAYGQYC